MTSKTPQYPFYFTQAIIYLAWQTEGESLAKHDQHFGGSGHTPHQLELFQ